MFMKIDFLRGTVGMLEQCGASGIGSCQGFLSERCKEIGLIIVDESNPGHFFSHFPAGAIGDWMFEVISVANPPQDFCYEM